MIKALLTAATLVLGLFASAGAAQAAPPSLDLPIACTIGQGCEVQNYMDAVPGPAFKDYRCGTRTYPDHGGVDIRIRDLAAMRAGVPVLASSAGTIARLRDGVVDTLPHQPIPAGAPQACGNAVVITHADGWETQYCHMRQGSVRVKVGQVVKAGDILGLVGQSGSAAFPHIHITVRQGAKTIDPFAYGAAPGSCGGGIGLWSAKAAAALAYKPRVILVSGFTSEEASVPDQITQGSPRPVSRTSPILIPYVFVLGLQNGDLQDMSLTAPDGRSLAAFKGLAVKGDKAQQSVFIGARLRGPAWPAGEYKVAYRVSRNGQTVLEQRFSLKL